MGGTKKAIYTSIFCLLCTALLDFKVSALEMAITDNVINNIYTEDLVNIGKTLITIMGIFSAGFVLKLLYDVITD